MEQIILASGSPRRQEYFKMMGLPFSVVPADIDESLITHTDPFKLTKELAENKVKKVIEMTRALSPRWIFGADTIIAADKKIFGKPSSRQDAASMLGELSGRQHKVITSMALFNGQKDFIDCRSACCNVSFAPVSEAEIEWYLNTNEWQDVAGAYRIQGLAACFIDKIEGCPGTVTGLPLYDFYVMLKDNGYPYGA
ncbi:MAG: Maf family protein [Treponema sp.]|jgi:septum formation protein|nr:Maf family protein [Treponema sp.]